MFDHVTIRASDRGASERFYATVLRPLGIEPTHSGEQYTEWDDFSVSQASDEKPVTRRLHVAFVSPSRDHVDEFWRAGTDAGYRDDGAPGPRPHYRYDYYGAFLRDPDGNSVEAVHHGDMRRGGWIDHLWIRVRDVAASRRFYETIASHAGFAPGHDSPERAQFRGETGSFSVVAGRPQRTSIWRFRRRTTPPWTRSTAPRPPPATATTAARASAPSTTPATTPRSSSTPTATTSSS